MCKKIANIIIYILLAVYTLCFFACDAQNGGDGRNPQIVKIYNAYVAYAEEEGITPLSYEAWLLSVKGEKGDDGLTPTVEISDDGFWVINGIKTEHKAKGETGNAAVVEISSDGYWVINGIKTEDKATDADGRTYYDLYVEFPIWRETADADDYDGDRQITFADFTYYKEFKRWKLSGNAYDYDGDRVITLADFAIYNDPQQLNLLEWLDSDNAYDYNNDGFVDKTDFIFYINYKNVIGKFDIVNFEYQASKNVYLTERESKYFLSDLANDIADFDFEISKDLKLNCVYGEEVKQKLGESESDVINAINSLQIEKLSEVLYSASFTLQELDFTIYLSKTESGFSSSINAIIDDYSVSIAFDMVYVR